MWSCGGGCASLAVLWRWPVAAGTVVFGVDLAIWYGRPPQTLTGSVIPPAVVLCGG